MDFCRKSEIANENLRIFKKIQAIERSPSVSNLPDIDPIDLDDFWTEYKTIDG